MARLLFSRLCVAAMAVTFGGCAVAQDFEEATLTASNGVSVSIVTIPRSDRREVYSPVLEGETSDIYAGRVDIGEAEGALFLQGSAYYRGRAHLYERATFSDGNPAVFKRGPVEVRGCIPNHDGGRSDCLWSEDFTVTITTDEVVRYGQNGVLEVELSGGPTPETSKLSIPINYIYAVVEVAGAR